MSRAAIIAAAKRRSGGGGGGSAVAPDWISSGTHTPGSLSAGYPASPAAGDMLEYVVNWTGGDGTTDYTLAGWTVGVSVTFPSAFGGFKTFYKTATGTESGSVAATQTGTVPSRDGAIINRYTGVNLTASPYEGTANNNVANVGADTSYETPALTTTANGRLLVDLIRSNTTVTFAPITAGLTEAWDVERTGIGPDYHMAMYYKDATGFGAQALHEIAVTASTGYGCLSYALIGV